jgi:hypothetical protein
MSMIVIIHLSIIVDNCIVFDFRVLLIQQKGEYPCVNRKHSSSMPGLTFRTIFGGYKDPYCDPICPIKSICQHSENCQNGRESC